MSEYATARVSHSVLHPDWVAQEAARRYELEGAVTAQLLYRGMNDIYIVEDATTRYALRVWRKSWRDVDTVQVELDFLDYLRERAFPASTPLRTRGGKLYFKVNSPEGLRAVALYTWAPGRKFGEVLDEDTAARIGAVFAEMHQHGIEYLDRHTIAKDDVVDFLINMPALMDFLSDRPDDARTYDALAPRLAERLERMIIEGVPLGLCHRDFHPSNVHVAEDGGITLLDFDAAGHDFLMQDVKNYTWGNLFYGFSPAYGEAFEAGYASVRPFTAAELQHAELFLLAKTFRLMAGMARSSIAVGRGTLRFRNLDWFSDYIRTRANNLDLL